MRYVNPQESEFPWSGVAVSRFVFVSC